MLSHKLSTGYYGHHFRINSWMNLIFASSKKKGHQFNIFSNLQKLLVSRLWSNADMPYTDKSQVLNDVFKLKAGDNEPIWHGWYPSHITVVDNTGEAWGTSSPIKGNDGVSDPSLCIFLWFYLPFLNSSWLKSLKNNQKLGSLIQQPTLNIKLAILLFI